MAVPLVVELSSPPLFSACSFFLSSTFISEPFTRVFTAVIGTESTLATVLVRISAVAFIPGRKGKGSFAKSV